MNCYGCTSIPEAMADERDGFPGLHFHPQPMADQGIVNDQFCQIQALKSEEQPDAVVRLIDTYILDVERILSNLKSYIDLPDVDFSKLAVEICKIEEKSLQAGSKMPHLKHSSLKALIYDHHQSILTGRDFFSFSISLKS
ncbi:histidine-containing phosphotransfer protein 3-like isoform X4 [Vitis riparia]|uniref:histidine-containing phosphotransfer protein 3-like isoform X4 n=1 Tax=Vitis riparia TaxID=96939 RepID=UPI00155B1EC6|nr:histidine-containing phosphotransfer protein 3-like isoform X4 [Vitis riparia]